MANVLPEKNLSQIKNEYHARALVTFGGVLLLASLIASVPLFLASHNAANTSMIPKISDPSPEEIQFQKDVKRARALVFELKDAVYASSTPSQAIAVALSMKPAGIEVDQVNYTRDVKGAIAISGTAPSPEVLDTYRAALLKRPDLYSEVALPVQALVNSEGGRFTLTLTGAF